MKVRAHFHCDDTTQTGRKVWLWILWGNSDVRVTAGSWNGEASVTSPHTLLSWAWEK